MKADADLKNQIQKAHRADELLNDPLIQEFIISLRGDLLNKFESTGLEDEVARLDAWQQSQVLNKFLAKFTKAISDGKNANLTLADRYEIAKNKIRNII